MYLIIPLFQQPQITDYSVWIFPPPTALTTELLMVPILLIPKVSFRTDYTITSISTQAQMQTLVPGHWDNSQLAYPNAFAESTSVSYKTKTGVVNLDGLWFLRYAS